MKKLNFDLKDVGNVSEVDFEEMFNDSYIDPSEVIERPPIAVSIGYHEYKGKSYPTPFGSYGDFSCIVGASKSRKTFLKSALIAGYIGCQAQNYFGDIKGHDTEERLIIDIDTEQSKYHTQRVQHRIIEMVGAVPENYKTLTLRKYEPSIRLDFIEYVLYEKFKDYKIGLVCIDGYADLIDSFNDEEKSSKLVNKLMKWTTEKDCHITGIVHANYGSRKPVGHVGSYIMKKSETVAFAEKEEDITKVNCDYSRNISFEEFGFIVDNNTALPKAVDISISNNNKIIKVIG